MLSRAQLRDVQEELERIPRIVEDVLGGVLAVDVGVASVERRHGYLLGLRWVG
jgi:hypothetical protein